MKKIIVTADNYEEVMFDLLEGQYPKEIREDILDQVRADTFLSFEWSQWSKASFSASTEPYKTGETEFIESLTRQEEKRSLIYWLAPAGIAAGIMLLSGVYMLSGPLSLKESAVSNAVVPAAGIHVILDSALHESGETGSVKPENAGLPPVGKISVPHQVKNAVETAMPSPAPDTLARITLIEAPEHKSVMDTIRSMLYEARKQQRYKITIVEEKIGQLDGGEYRYREKRYSMADVLNHKDGITLSKFLENPQSRIVTDKATRKVTIEYVAEDQSVLVLTLSQ